MGALSLFTSVGPDHIPSVMDAFKAALVADGATVTDLNSDNSYHPSAVAYHTGKEWIATFPGDALRAAGGVIGCCYAASSGAVVGMHLWAATGHKVIPLATVETNAGVATLESASPHGLTTGDLVFWNGNSDPLNNVTIDPTADFARCTVVDPTHITVPTLSGLTRPNAAGGTAVQVFNFIGSRFVGAFPINGFVQLTNANITAYIKATKFDLSADIEQGGAFIPVKAGLSGQGHTAALTTSVGKLTSQIVSDGIAASVLPCDRVMTNTRVNQKLQVIPTDALGPAPADPAFIDGAQCHYPAADVTAVSTNQVTAVIPAGTYPVGSIVGRDPVPMMVVGGSIAAGNLAVNNGVACTHRTDGTRLTGVNTLRYTNDVIAFTNESDRIASTPSNLLGFSLGREIGCYETAPVANEDARETIGSWSAASPGNNNYDILRIEGGTALLHDWIHFASITLGSWTAKLGPLADPA